MSDVASLIADMVRAGVDPELIGRTAQAIAERDESRPRSSGAERQARYLSRPVITPRLRMAVLARDGFACRYCGSTVGTLECDHVVPASRGGATDENNLVAACKSCNASKKDRTPEEWGGRCQ